MADPAQDDFSPSRSPSSWEGVSDGQLLLRYRTQDDRRAFEELIRRYQTPLFHYLSHYLHDASLAEDVRQATFLRVHEKRDAYSPARELHPWLYSIATHLAVDAVRKEGRQRAVSLDVPHEAADAHSVDLLDLLESPIPSPPEQAEIRERQEHARRVVQTLPDELREAVLLVYFEGRSYREAADILGLALGTLKTNIHKALLALNHKWRLPDHQLPAPLPPESSR
jgi:RNA polymerase sigma-70 factor, ECF subfamily